MKYNIKAAVLGAGFMGKTHADVLKNLVDTFMVCDKNEEAGSACAEKHGAAFYTDYIEMLEKEQPDFVSVCLPTHLHHYAAMEAIKRKIPVLCEKPFAIDDAQAKEMISAAREHKVLLMVAHPLRFSPEYVFLQTAIGDNRYGKLLALNLFRHSETPVWSAGNWLLNDKQSGGVTKDLHIHETDFLVSLFGVPQAVQTHESGGFCQTQYFYDNQAVISASASWRNIAGFPFDAGFDAVFENATLRLRQKELTLYTNGKEEKLTVSSLLSEPLTDNPYENEINYFCNCLVNQKQTDRNPPEQSLLSILVNQAELKSANSGSIQEVLVV